MKHYIISITWFLFAVPNNSTHSEKSLVANSALYIFILNIKKLACCIMQHFHFQCRHAGKTFIKLSSYNFSMANMLIVFSASKFSMQG